MVGLILEQVTREPVSRLIERRIIQPLRLRHTYLPDRSPDIAGYHAHGYTPPSLTGAGYVDQTLLTPTIAWSAGALISNVDDLRRFYRALLGGQLLRPEQLAQMKDLVPVSEEDGFGYGLGIFAVDSPCGQVWGHDGGIPGYATVALGDETGRRNVEIALPTDADEPIATAFTRLLTIAGCRALGHEPPPASASSAQTSGSAQGSASSSGSALGGAERGAGSDSWSRYWSNRLSQSWR